VIVSVALADLVVSVSEVAAIVTVPPVGTAVGAVYVVKTVPDPGDTFGLNEPQTFDPQAAVQTTPASNGSLLTWAFRVSVVSISMELTVGARDTPIGAATMVMLTLLLCDGLLVTVAVTVMEPLMGITDGAV
jgi:hypothetical protein